MADTNHKIQATTQALSSLKSGVTGVSKAWDAYADSVSTAAQAQNLLQDSAYKGTGGFIAMTQSLSKSAEQFKDMSRMFESLGTGMGKAQVAFNAFGKTVEFLGETFAVAAQKQRMLAEDLSYWDSFSSFTRRLETDMRSLGGSFGEGVEKSRELAKAYVDVQKEVSLKDYGNIGGDELKSFSDQLKAVNLETSYLNERVQIGAKNFNLMGAAILQAGYMGMESSAYMKLLGDSIMKQGMDSEAAMESIAGFSIVSRETGLSVDSISRSLNDTANSFAMLGMSADFGRPLILGYADSLGEMGLGLDNALQLSSKLSSVLGELGTKYDKAFLLQQRGGLDIGAGGGALGAGIGIQSAMLKAEGDPGAQADLSSKLAMSLKDTLASFGGGKIVTVSEAAENPQLQNAFYIQQQLLEKQFGMDSKSSVRTLEMLAELEEATRRGDTDLAGELEKQIASETEGRDSTLDELKKLNVTSAASLALSMMQLKGSAAVARKGAGYIKDSYGENVVGDFNTDYKAGIEKLFSGGLGDVTKIIDKKMSDTVMRDGKSPMDRVTEVYGKGAQAGADKTVRSVEDEFMGSKPMNFYEDTVTNLNREGNTILRGIELNGAGLEKTMQDIAAALVRLASKGSPSGAP